MNSLVYFAFFAFVVISVDSESLLSDGTQASVTFKVVNLEETDELINVVKAAFVNKVNSTTLGDSLGKAFREDPLINSQTKTQTYFLEGSLLKDECADLKHAAKNIAKKDLLKISVKC
uniref:Salivary secreted peptide n=1 Tax=Panagrellus redivivus TaxID=6233 RepID=A0A7E4W0N3_PANRE